PWGSDAGEVHETQYSYTYGEEANVNVSGSKWEWTIPSEEGYVAELGQGPYSYEITYYTLINEELYGEFNFDNSVDESKTHNADAASYTYNNTSQQTYLRVTKKATEVTEKYIKWQVTIPRQDVDLNNAYLTDIHPNESGYVERIVTDPQKAVDLGIIANTTDEETAKIISVSGLITGEATDTAAAVAEGAQNNPKAHEEISRVYSSPNSTVFQFRYISAADESGERTTTNRLKAKNVGNGKDDVVITYYTENDQNWLRRTMSEGLNQDHVNKVRLQANRQYAESSDKAVPKLPGFEKVAEKQPVDPPVDVDGVPMDKLKFTLILKGIDDKKGDDQPVNGVLYSANNWFNDENNLVIEEEFDASLQMLGQESGNTLTLYQDIPAPAEGQQKKTVTATWTEATSETEGKKKVTITIPKDNFGGTYGLVYSLPYYMTYASLAKAQELSENKMTGEGKTRYATFNNTATVKEIPVTRSDSVNVDVDLKPIEKTAEKLNNGKYEYTIAINPLGAELNGGNDYRLTDNFENLAVDYPTMQIYKVTYAEGQAPVQTDVTKDILWSYHGNEGIFWLHDKTPYILKYQVWPVGKLDTSFVMTNTAEMLGFDDTVTRDVTLSSEHSGTIRSYKLKLLKHADDAMGRGIEYVVFQLFMLNDAGERVP
ncbi:MAG: hypothetical protein IJ107_03940, partial [Lachnospiraceae bacterium]|nr:hypothetical protein [Lachnospiraceae bacterium]